MDVQFCLTTLITKPSRRMHFFNNATACWHTRKDTSSSPTNHNQVTIPSSAAYCVRQKVHHSTYKFVCSSCQLVPWHMPYTTIVHRWSTQAPWSTTLAPFHAPPPPCIYARLSITLTFSSYKIQSKGLHLLGLRFATGRCVRANLTTKVSALCT